MNEIKFYISNIDPNLLQSICGRSGELIELIKAQRFTSEEALASKLFTGKWSNQNYLNLKSRTKAILSAYFLISTSKKSTETAKKIKRCRKLYLLGMNFVESGKREIAKKLLLQVFKTATEYDFTSLAHDSTTELMITASLERKAPKFKHYKEKTEKLALDLQAENMAQRYYYEMALLMNSKRSSYSGKLKEYIQHLESFSCSSAKFTQYFYTLCIIQAMYDREYKLVKQSAGTALNILKDKKGVYNSSLQLFTKNKAIAHIALKEFKVAEQLLIQAEEYAPPRSINFAILKYYQALNAMHSGAYNKAYELYRANRKNRFETLQEQWTIMGAYFYFLKKAGLLETGSDRFSIGKYLNETVDTSHDKTGNNISILIAELLVYLVKNRTRFINRVEAIQNYSYKYLKASDTNRAKWFIRILCMMPRANFNSIALERIAKKQIENLKNHPIEMGDNFAVEIIPFEELLGIVLKRLSVRVA